MESFSFFPGAVQITSLTAEFETPGASCARWLLELTARRRTEDRNFMVGCIALCLLIDV